MSIELHPWMLLDSSTLITAPFDSAEKIAPILAAFYGDTILQEYQEYISSSESDLRSCVYTWDWFVTQDRSSTQSRQQRGVCPTHKKPRKTISLLMVAN